jgi:hypothetical protein
MPQVSYGGYLADELFDIVSVQNSICIVSSLAFERTTLNSSALRVSDEDLKLTIDMVLLAA